MTARLRAWLEETHGAAFELVRHFLVRFFDNEMVSIPGEWQKVAAGIVASLISVSLAALKIYWERYKHLHGEPFDVYRQGVRDDLISFIALAMAITALLTILQWQSLFPSLRDCLALAGLPLKPREIFLAKFTALLVIFGVFVLALAAMPSVLFAVVISMKWFENPHWYVNIAANFAALSGACAFVFFGLLAIQGLLLHLLPSRIFERVSLAVQAVMFILIVGALPLMGRQPTAAAWWPPVWFLHLWEAMVTGPASLARPALLAVFVPAAVAILAYLLSYHRYRRMLLEALPGRASSRSAGLGARLLERWIPDPREQAAFAFIWKTLTRSGSHRLLLLAYAGMALGWVTKGLLDAPPVNLSDEGLYGLVVVLAPIALSVLIVVGLRYLFALPVTPRANWVFQIAEAEDRLAWFAAIERFVLWCGIVPVFAAGLPTAIAILGPLRALAATALGFAAALLFFERYFRDWRKLPFTCSYLPGKQTVWMLIVRTALGSAVLGPAAQLFLWASADQAAWVAVATSLCVFVWRWRAVRWREWAASTFLWDEQPEPIIQKLNLESASRQEERLSFGQSSTPALEFGNMLTASRGLLPAAWSEEIRQDRETGRDFWETLFEDLRYGARLIRRNPLLSAVVVLTLTVGIGINASVYTVVDGLALKAHVQKDPESFLRISPVARETARPRSASYAEYTALRDSNRSLRQLAAFRVFPALIGDDDATGTPGLAVSCNFFLVEGLDRPLLGRLLDANDCRAPGQNPVAIIGESVWRNRFGADSAIIGRIARINNRSIPIVGVVPDRTSLWVQPAGVWLPYTVQPYLDGGERNFFEEDFLWLRLAGRLRPGQTREMAQAEFQGLEQRFDSQETGRHTNVTTTDGSWIEEFNLMAGARELFLMSFLFGAFHLVLLIACANVATLLLSRAASRRREIAVRLSLGAPRIRLLRMLVTESLLLATLAGAASTWLLYHVPQPLFRYLAPHGPDIPLPPDWRVFGYVAIVVLFTGIVSGIAPAFESFKVDLAASMKGSGGMIGEAAGGSRMRGWLVTAQVAMSMLLLVQAALLGQSENRTLNADPGYQPRQIVVAPLGFPEGTTRGAVLARLGRIADHMRAVPGVRAVTFSDEAPMVSHYTLELRPPARPDAVQPVDIQSASAGYMAAIGVPLLRGRDFVESDRDAVIVSNSLAKAFFRRVDPLGQTIRFPNAVVTVVGITRDIETMRFGGSDNPIIWRTGLTHPNRSFMSVRFDSAALAAGPTVRTAVHQADPNLVVIARNLQSWIDLVTEQLWNVVSLILILGLVATVLSTTGIYGAVSYAVNQRMRDLGIRVALGAQSRDIVREVLVMGGKPVVRGLLMGLWLSVAMAAALRENLKDTALRVDSSNPWVYGAALGLLMLAALIAMIAPARRGTKSDPLEALRCD